MRIAQMRTVSTASPAALSRWKRLFRLLSRPGANPFVPTSRNLAQVRSESFSELWFTAAVPAKVSTGTNYNIESGPFVRSEGISSIGGNGNDHKPPDERTVKLGKSVLLLKTAKDDMLTRYSFANTLTSSSKYLDYAITTRTHFSEHFTTSFPINTSSFTGSQRQNPLQSGTVDGASGVGSCAHRRQCQVTDHKRKDSSLRLYHSTFAGRATMRWSW